VAYYVNKHNNNGRSSFVLFMWVFFSFWN